MTKTYLLQTLSVLFFCALNLNAQEETELNWLSGFSENIIVGSNTNLHKYYALDTKGCKLKFVTEITDKKGNTKKNAYVFYLSDINPDALSFKPTGKYISINIEAKASQKYIMEYNDGELAGYVNSFSLYTNAVDKARSMIDAIKSNQGSCKSESLKWTDLENTIEWLTENIRTVINSDTENKQQFHKGSKSYIAEFNREYSNSKGEKNAEKYLFNLTDIDPYKINLKVSGKDLIIELNVKNKQKYIEYSQNNLKEAYRYDLEILASDLENARNIIMAFEYLVQETKTDYQKWNNSNDALKFIQNIVTASYNSLKNIEQTFVTRDEYIALNSKITDSKGTTMVYERSCYLPELKKNTELYVSGSSVYIKLTAENDFNYVKVIKDGEQQSYDDEIEIIAENIETARELINAFNYVLSNAGNGISPYTKIGDAVNQIVNLTTDVLVETENKSQKIVFDTSRDYKLSFKMISGEETSIWEVFPEDIGIYGIEVKISGKKLYVSISTGKSKYVAYIKNDVQQYYTNDFEIYFDDTHNARNFKFALNYLIENHVPNPRTVEGLDKVNTILQLLTPEIKAGDETFKQKIETMDTPCKLKITSIETDSKGETAEKVYEFILSDIDHRTTNIIISGKTCGVELATKGDEKLIKPYENGEAKNFTDGMVIITKDILEAKIISEAIKAGSESCK